MNLICIGSNTRNLLPEIVNGRASAYYALIRGVPEEVDHVEVHFGKPENASTNAVVCRRVPGGDWKVYANGFFFPDVGKTVYHITARSDKGDSVYLGGGTLRVTQSVLNVTEGEEPIIPADTMVRNPRTGLWHKLTAEVNDDGQVVVGVEKEGITV